MNICPSDIVTDEERTPCGRVSFVSGGEGDLQKAIATVATMGTKSQASV